MTKILGARSEILGERTLDRAALRPMLGLL